ncbi:MAG: PAS domain S-box protein, partial [Verrucomicrobiota bacterium]|nr:PAS domain S-box protein [Verrucomicrobiota bacterium]
MSQKHQDERVIIIAPVGQDAAAMAGLLSAEGFAAHACEDVFECSRQLMAGAGVFLLTEEALDLPGVSDLLEVLKAQPSWSELPLIILTSGGELRAGRLSNLTAADAGAVTLLERPLNMRTLVRSVQVALRSRQRQYQVRDLIDQQQRHIDERKRVEEALRASQAALEFTLESAQVGDWDLDLIHDTSRRSLRHDQCLGYNEPIPEKDWGFEVFIQHVHPEDRARVERDFREAVSELKDWHFECRVVWPDESIHWIAVHGSIYRAEDGKPVRMLGIIANITERKQAEEALLESRQRITNIVESITDAFTTVDKKWRYTYLNQRAEEILLPLQKSRENLLGKNLSEEFPDLIGTVVEENYRRCMAEQVTVEFEFFYPPLDGWFEVRLFPSNDGIASYFQDITERKKGEEALRESEERFRSLVSIITDVPWTTDAQGAFVVPQLAWEKYSGQSWKEHRGFGWTNALHPEDREAVKEIWEAAKQARSLYEARGRLWHVPSQQYRHFVARATPLIDANGEVRAWVGTCTDCHDAKAAEEALRASEERFRTAVGAVSDIIWTNNPGGMMVGEQPGWSAFTGQRQEDYQGYGWSKAVHPDDAQPNLDAWKAAVAEKRMFEFEHRVRRHDGAWRSCSIRAVPVSGEDGEIREWVGVHTDITDRKHAEENAASQKRLLEALTESVLDGILIVSLEGRMIHFNQRFLKIWNFPSSVLEQRSDEAALQWAAGQTADPAAFLGGVAAAYQTPDKETREELLMADGRVYERCGSPVHLGGTPMGWVWTFRDMTERRASVENLRFAKEQAESASR